MDLIDCYFVYFTKHFIVDFIKDYFIRDFYLVFEKLNFKLDYLYSPMETSYYWDHLNLSVY